MIILDISGSMSNIYGSSTRLEVAKDAISVVIGGLSNSDWVGFVAFSSKALPFSDTLIPATIENKNKLI